MHRDRLRSLNIEGANMTRIPRREFLRLAAAAVAVPAASRRSIAEAFPSRPITIVVPFAAGGPNDAIGRYLAERMRGALGQTVMIENATGAGGTIGVGRVARAAPDGYTLSLGVWSTHVVNGAVYTLPYDLIRDFDPVALISREFGMVLTARNGMPEKDLRELIAWLKSNPDGLSVGTAGVGSPPHIAAVLFRNLTGTRFQMVHFRGTAPAAQDLMAGQIDMLFDSQITSLPSCMPRPSRPTRSRQKAGWPRRRIFRRWTRRDSPGCTSRHGLGCGLPGGDPKRRHHQAEFGH